VAKPGSLSGLAAAYWASLGLAPDVAEKNLQECRAGIQAFDVQGEQELADALGALGVHVVKRSPEITVTLVGDYLEEQLSEVNKGQLSSALLGCSRSRPVFSRWLGQCSGLAKGLAGCVSRIAWCATGK